MVEVIICFIVGSALIVVFGVLIISLIRDYKLSKEWHRIFKDGDRDD